jgi:hypothetical protein
MGTDKRHSQIIEKAEIRYLRNVAGYTLKDQTKNTLIKNKIIHV